MILKWGIMNRNIFWHMHTNIGTTSRQLHIYLIKLKSIVYENSYNNISYISHTGGRLNIKKSSYQYRDSHVEDKTVSPTVLSLTLESPYPGKTVFIFLDGAVSIRKTVLPGMAIPMLKIRRPNDRLIFNIEITIRR